MSLISQLIKRYGISTLCDISWAQAVPSRKPNHKPCFTSDDPNVPKLEFNVSHQAGLVTMVSSSGASCQSGSDTSVELGTDIVCVNERDDYGKMERERDGFFAFVDMHADVFADGEKQYLKLSPDNLNLPELEGVEGYGRDAVSRCQHRNKVLRWKDKSGEERTMQSNVVIDAKLRRFYALWCLREAYVKMTGEALLAPWLGELEFKGFRAPTAKLASSGVLREGEMGEVVTDQDFEIWFKGKRVLNVGMQLTALGQDFMLATAVRSTSGERIEMAFNAWKWIDVEKDIYPVANKRSTTS